MAEQYIYPVGQVNWGTNYNHGHAHPLTHTSTSSYMHYDTGAGSIVVFPEVSEPSTPVIAVGVRYQQGNGGLFTWYNGWVEAHLEYDDVLEPASRSYVQDGVSTSTVRTINGPPVYRPGMEPWTASEINRITGNVRAAVGPIGPNKNNRWCQCNGVQLVLYTADPVPVPYFNSAPTTISTSSVNFSATLPDTQRAQPVRAVFQVARDTGFSEDVRTFVGSLHAPTSNRGDVVSIYQSEVGTDSWTDLGPGRWYLRVKGRDFLGSESAWSTAQHFTISHPTLSVPSMGEPSWGTPTRGPYEVRSASVGTPDTEIPGGRKVGVRWQFSQDRDFASGVIQWLNLDGVFFGGLVSYDPSPADIDPGLNGSQASYRDPAQYLAQGIWHVRVRAEDKYGQFSDWSHARLFLVEHPPLASPVRPIGGDYFDPVGGVLEWDFIDSWGSDRQTAYAVEVRDAQSNLVFSSGWVPSPLEQAVVEVPERLLNTTLSWRARTRDLDGVEGSWSSAQTFHYVRRPSVVITEPEAMGYVEAGQPRISWEVAFHQGATQTGYRVLVLEQDTRRVVYDSGYVIDNHATEHMITGTYLDNMTNHEVTVRVTDSNALSGDHRTTFTTNFVLPPTVATSASPFTYDPEGYVRVIWDGPVDPLFEEWRVYRRPVDSEQWTLAASTHVASAREAKDWTLSAPGEYIYAVVQVASRHGSLVEGSRDSHSAAIRLRPDSYWLVVPEMDFGLRIVPSSDSFTRERESSSMDIIGRGRKVNVGPAVSREGSITVPVRHLNRGMSPSELVAQIDLIVTGVTGVYLRDPFGNYFPVALGSYTMERMAGVGPTEMGDIELSYVEVFE